MKHVQLAAGLSEAPVADQSADRVGGARALQLDGLLHRLGECPISGLRIDLEPEALNASHEQAQRDLADRQRRRRANPNRDRAGSLDELMQAGRQGSVERPGRERAGLLAHACQDRVGTSSISNDSIDDHGRREPIVVRLHLQLLEGHGGQHLEDWTALGDPAGIDAGCTKRESQLAELRE
jgi:hypothetical protein